MLKIKLFKYAAYFLCVAALLSVSFFRLLESYELQTFDLRFSLRPPLKVNQDIVIIEIAEDSIREFGRWPFSRKYHAYLIDCLRQLGARAIIFDILFGEESPDDAELIEATGAAKGLVYYPIVLALERGGKAAGPKAVGIEVPLIDGLARAAKGVGFINAVADSDGKTRRVALTAESADKKHFQLAYLAAKDYVNGSSLRLPLGDDGNFLVNYPGKWNGTFKHYSFADVLASFEQTVRGEESRINLSNFYNKVCFVGQTEIGGHDLKPNPLEPAYPMMGVHASIFNSIAENKFLIRAKKEINLALLLALCVIVALAVNKARPLSGLGISSSAIFIFIAFGFTLFIFFGVWIDLFCPVTLAIGVYLGFTVKRYFIEKRERLLMERELSIARQIQMDFLPSSTPQAEDIDIAASIETAKAVGGDLYDFPSMTKFSVEDKDKLGVMIGDVSGKGVYAALFMARSIADFRHLAAGVPSPSFVLAGLNKEIALNYKTGLFVTMFYMIYDRFDKSLVYSNGGHPPAICLKAAGQVEFLRAEGIPLGLMDSAVYSQTNVKLDAGDAIILYTDGVTEARNANKEEFGEKRLVQAVVNNRDLPVNRILEEIKAHLAKFVGAAPQYDDCTIIVFKVR
ncbi:MAG: CHASE2 domain-containing protein [Candidatus Omnitrophota bacterium]